MTPLLTISNLCINSGSKRLINGISLVVNHGETVGIVGESGSGKTLTSSAIINLLPDTIHVTSGTIHFENENLLSKSQKEMESIRGRGIGKILQDPMTSLNPVLTIGDQLTEGICLHFNLSKQQAKERALELLTLMDIKDALTRYDQYPHELSGGQRQRVLIAIALSCQPKLLIADEPTTALDNTTQRQLLSLLKERQREHNMALLFISHDLHVVAEMCERVIVMKNGEIIEEGPVKEILNNPKDPYTKMLVNSKTSLITKKTVSTPRAPSSPLLSIKKLHKSYPQGKTNRSILHNISLEIGPGQTIGIAGQSGCGKSTLGKCISRLTEIDQGSIQFFGQEISQLSNHLMVPIRRHMQIIFQNPYASLNPRLTILKILLEPLEIHQLFHGKAALKRVDELMESVGLSPTLLNCLPSQLSGGQRQRVAIARAIAVEPKLIICDEILSSLDAATQIEIIHLLQSLQERFGVSYLFISHDASVIEYLSDQVIIMSHGEIINQTTRRS
jgi:peptide/nickel transport system ATP-binding protein